MKRLTLLVLLPLIACGARVHDDEPHDHVIPHVLLNPAAAFIAEVVPPVADVTDDWDAPPDVPKRAVILDPSKESQRIQLIFCGHPAYVDVNHYGPSPVDGVGWSRSNNESRGQFRIKPIPGAYLEYEIRWNCARAKLSVWTPMQGEQK